MKPSPKPRETARLAVDAVVVAVADTEAAVVVAADIAAVAGMTGAAVAVDTEAVTIAVAEIGNSFRLSLRGVHGGHRGRRGNLSDVPLDRASQA